MGKLILNGIEYAGGPSIDDTNAAATKVYSSQKTQNLVEGTLGTDEYDATHAYAAGDLCIYNNKIYKAKSSTTGNLPTDTTYWDETSISDLINTKQNSTDSSLNTASKTIVGGINELASGKANFSDISSSVSFGSDINASGSFKWVVKIGKLVYIYANLRPKENWSSSGNKILLSNLPSRADYQESNYIPYIVGMQYFNSTTNEIRGAAVNGSNQLQTQNGANITTTNRIYINGFYRCQ